MTEYLLGLLTLPFLAGSALAIYLAFAPNGSTPGSCVACNWECTSKVPVIQWFWEWAHRLFQSHRVEHVRRVRDYLVRSNYNKEVIMRFDRRHRRAMNKIIREES